jgi:hypothetical protein
MSYLQTGMHPEFFIWRERGADPEGVYNLFNFENCVIKIIT